MGLHNIRAPYHRHTSWHTEVCKLHVNHPNVFGVHGALVSPLPLASRCGDLRCNFISANEFSSFCCQKKTNCCQHYYHANNGFSEKRVSGLRGASPSCRQFFLRWRLLSVSLPIVLRAAETARDPGNFNSWGLGRLELWAGRDFRDKSHPSAKMSPSRVRGHYYTARML